MIHQNNITNYLRLSANLLKTAFQHVSISELYKSNTREHACVFSTDGKTLLPSLFSYLEDDLKLGNRQQLEELIQSFFAHLNVKPITVFDVLFYFADNMLYPRRDAFRYRYEYTDIWRSYTRFFDEEPITAAAVLINESRRGNRRVFPLDWPYCANCDNAELLSMLNREQGTSENHFHFRGSSPYFYISWVYLMNHVDNRIYESNIQKIENNRLKHNLSSDRNESLHLLWRKAAAIRLYLYHYVSETNHSFLKFKIHWDEVSNDIKQYGLCEDSMSKERKEDDWISVGNLRQYYLKTTESFRQFQRRCLEGMYQWLHDLLSCDDLQLMSINLLQEEIRNTELLHDGQIDYAQVKGSPNQMYYHLQGERYLLTQVLRKIYSKTIGYECAEDLLYLYLVMKHQFRSELVQSNERNGFHNFLEFQNRKSLFVPWEFEKELATDTICSMIEDVKICHAELRITPEETVEENINIINMYDDAIKTAIRRAKKNGQKQLPKKKQFFYTFHFFKLEDKQHHELRCRNHESRIAAENRAEAILQLRERIYGIDACAAEIRCRPETFGPVFRRMQYYDPSVTTINHSNVHQLMATYHVGEDNYDIVDSLRAIDEAILFLQLRSGCRLGHASLLFYLENETDENGKRKYTRLQVMQWLNQIRIMGNEQSFAN